jgi:hypothetical protein
MLDGYKTCMGRNGVYGGSVNITAVSEICKASAKVYFVYEGQIRQPPTTGVGIFIRTSNKIIFSSNLSP